MSDVVLDASALLALLRGEAGAEVVGRRLQDATLSAVNLTEVVAKLADHGMPEIEIRRAIAWLELDIRPFDEAQAYTAGMLRQKTRRLGLSLGDRACLALADGSNAVALTADRSWPRLDLGIAIEVIR